MRIGQINQSFLSKKFRTEKASFVVQFSRHIIIDINIYNHLHHYILLTLWRLSLRRSPPNNILQRAETICQYLSNVMVELHSVAEHLIRSTISSTNIVPHSKYHKGIAIRQAQFLHVGHHHFKLRLQIVKGDVALLIVIVQMSDHCFKLSLR